MAIHHIYSTIHTFWIVNCQKGWMEVEKVNSKFSAIHLYEDESLLRVILFVQNPIYLPKKVIHPEKRVKELTIKIDSSFIKVNGRASRI